VQTLGQVAVGGISVELIVSPVDAASIERDDELRKALIGVKVKVQEPTGLYGL
jgi:hypothetical protein